MPNHEIIKVINEQYETTNEIIKKHSKRSKKSKNYSKLQFSSIYNNQKYKYIITSGNNSKLIREAMKRRPWWVEIPNYNSVFNFKWQPTSRGMKFRELNTCTNDKKSSNSNT